MLSRILLWISLAGALFLLSDAKYEFPCAQGEFLNVTKSGRNICKPCPENHYWAQRLNNETEMVGAICIPCSPWLESPAGSLDISYCQCNNENCKDEQSKGSSMGLIIGILITIIVLGALIASLFWCKTYGPELLKALTGRHIAEAEVDDTRGGYEKMSNEPPSPNLLNCDIGIDITDEQVEDTGYNNETAVGDHNDIQAVLRAAVISEKRRSRIVSMSSMTDLDRCRAGSMNSVSGRSQTSRGPPTFAPAGYGPLGNSDKKPGYSQASELPLPNYADFAHTRKAQTAL